MTQSLLIPSAVCDDEYLEAGRHSGIAVAWSPTGSSGEGVGLQASEILP